MKIRTLALVALACTAFIFSSCSKEETVSSAESPENLKASEELVSDIGWAIAWMDEDITYQLSIVNGELEVMELECR